MEWLMMGQAISLEEQLCVGVAGAVEEHDISLLLSEVFDRIEADFPDIVLFGLAMKAGKLAAQAYAVTKDRPTWAEPMMETDLLRRGAQISLAADVFVWVREAESTEGKEEIETFKARIFRGTPGCEPVIYECTI